MTIPAYQHDSNIWPLLLQSQHCLPKLTTQANSSKEATPYAPTPPSANGSCTTSINNHIQTQLLSQNCYNKPQHCLPPPPLQLPERTSIPPQQHQLPQRRERPKFIAMAMLHPRSTCPTRLPAKARRIPGRRRVGCLVVNLPHSYYNPLPQRRRPQNQATQNAIIPLADTVNPGRHLPYSRNPFAPSPREGGVDEGMGRVPNRNQYRSQPTCKLVVRIRLSLLGGHSNTPTALPSQLNQN